MHYTWSPILSDKTGAKRSGEFDKRGSMGAPGSTRHFTVLQPVPLPRSGTRTLSLSYRRERWSPRRV